MRIGTGRVELNGAAEMFDGVVEVAFLEVGGTEIAFGE
jgi:hypothetical protein